MVYIQGTVRKLAFDYNVGKVYRIQYWEGSLGTHCGGSQSLGYAVCV